MQNDKRSKEEKLKTAIYPGSFDPVTNGHLDVVERAARIFDSLTVAVLNNPRKTTLFSLEERIGMIQETLSGLPNVTVEGYNGLTVDFARKKGANFIIRSLRAISDFENELQMAHTNQKLAPEIEVVFLMTSPQFSFLSSSIVKEVAQFGGDVSEMVPPAVVSRLAAKRA